MNVYEMPFAIGEMMIDQSLKVAQTFALAHEQGERMTRLALDQSKVIREESLKVAQKWAEAARENQKQAMNLYTSSFNLGMEGLRIYQQQVSQNFEKAAKAAKN